LFLYTIFHSKPFLGYPIKNKSVSVAEAAWNGLLDWIGVETWYTDKVFPRFSYALACTYI